MAPGDAEIEVLLEQARSGDESARGSLIAAVRQRVFRWALIMTGDSDEAEDVTQRVSMTLHRKLDSYQAKARFTTWLYSVARNAAVELGRRPWRRREVAMGWEALPERVCDDVDRQLAEFDDRRAAALVRGFFTQLPARQRQLIELVDNDGLSIAEAADVMDIEASTARVHLLRARRTLRQKMLDLYPETFA